MMAEHLTDKLDEARAIGATSNETLSIGTEMIAAQVVVMVREMRARALELAKDPDVRRVASALVDQVPPHSWLDTVLPQVRLRALAALEEDAAER